MTFSTGEKRNSYFLVSVFITSIIISILELINIVQTNSVSQQIHLQKEYILSRELYYFGLDNEKIIKTLVYHHPLFTVKGVKAQKEKNKISGVNNTFYCGAYWGNGFHEDGVNSALDVYSFFDKAL